MIGLKNRLKLTRDPCESFFNGEPNRFSGRQTDIKVTTLYDKI